MEAEWLQTLKQGKCLAESDLFNLCEQVKAILMEENNVQPVSAPVIICGDIHGQFYDLLELFRVGGQIPEKNYIFMGDYVDRGYNSVETFEFLMALKVNYPQNITLLRGNHESRQITQVYGFYDECVRKYGNANPWKYCTEVFDYLNISAVVEDKILCVHGGLSPEIKTIDQMRVIERKVEIPHEGAFCDLMWSDPEDIETWSMSPRGAGWIFGSKVTEEFNYINGLSLICRAHQLVQEGYKFWFPLQNLVTVWSAPNYFYRCANQAAIFEVAEDLSTSFKMFTEVPESAKSLPPRAVVPYFL
ncbi:unnamed protein product [Blepharisma stoltei]|uniref:Serine/threonine-protein phosphatase n=1 Tax=Blepharisma stoltei TaxID=1481888 RepID=A0AAU9JAQ3_9CILI|nr:unnamed protein product [Blepharisma stoltei]